ncbi:hypothetical protein JXA84_03380 [candidate division WOR-3 bacterium]|nr:hypothetical protein [candidate division WOR-3 bacterium]
MQIKRRGSTAPEIMFIHGRAQGKKDPEEQKKAWIKALEKGLKSSGLGLPSEIKCIFPFYGDRLDYIVQETKFIPSIENTIRYKLLEEMAENGGLLRDKEIESEGEKSIFSDENFQKLLKLLERDLDIGPSFLRIFTKDVSMYLSREGVKKDINGIVVSEITENTRVVVGHSLGSVIGYEVLSGLEKPNIPLFITLGSPLGLCSVKRHVSKPFKKPDSVEEWINAFDERDFIALNKLDESNSHTGKGITNKNDICNESPGHHGIKGYLDNAFVATSIYNAALGVRNCFNTA